MTAAAQARAAASAVPVVAGARFPRITTRGAYDLATGEPDPGWGAGGGGGGRRRRGGRGRRAGAAEGPKAEAKKPRAEAKAEAKAEPRPEAEAPPGAGQGPAPPEPPPYRLYPKSYFDGLEGSPELVVMVHGLRNTTSDAARKFAIAKDRLRELGYGHPVVGYSYDSNTAGAAAASPEKRARAAAVGVRIAEQNGPRLAAFVRSFKASSPATRVRLLGHSLGSQVIFSALSDLAGRGAGRHPVESVHLFGASVPASAPSAGSAYAAAVAAAVRSSVTSYYAPTDEVLLEAAGWQGGGEGGGPGPPRPGDPLGLRGAHGRAAAKYRQAEVRPENHRFASYAAVLEEFP